MSDEADTLVLDREDAELESGFADEPSDKVAPKADEAAPPPAEKPAEPAPKYVQISESDWEEVRAAARKTASYDAQLSKAWGTIGNLQKQVTSAASAPPAGKREIPKEAFAAMERDFPELAAQIRGALEASLPAFAATGGDAPDESKLQAIVARNAAAREIEALEDAYPEWRKIVGAVDGTREQPDPKHPFRAWLASKDAAYQTRINNTESAAVIGRAIQRFETETKAAAPKPAAPARDQARADRIREAVQPRGAGSVTSAAKSEDDDFEAGFRSR